MAKIGPIGLAGIANVRRKYRATKFVDENGEQCIAICLRFPESLFTQCTKYREVITIFSVRNIVIDKNLNDLLFSVDSSHHRVDQHSWSNMLCWVLDQHDISVAARFSLNTDGQAVATEMHMDLVQRHHSKRYGRTYATWSHTSP